MATRIRVSSKGQVVLPKQARDRLGIAAGTVLEVFDTPTGVELRPERKAERLTIDEALARLRGIVRYDGPRLDEADWQRGIDEAMWHKFGQPRR